MNIFCCITSRTSNDSVDLTSECPRRDPIVEIVLIGSPKSPSWSGCTAVKSHHQKDCSPHRSQPILAANNPDISEAAAAFAWPWAQVTKATRNSLNEFVVVDGKCDQ